MRIVFHIGHPAHFNLYKNVIEMLHKSGNEVLVTYIKKDIVVKVLSELPVKKICVGNHSKIFLKKILSVPYVESKLYRVCRDFAPDIGVESGSFYLMHVSKLLSFKSYYFCDTETASLINPMSKYFSQKIFTPRVYRKSLGENQIRYNGMQELSYLHPDVFKPSRKILDDLNISENERIITFRIVSWDATHDSSLFTPKNSLRFSKIKEISKSFKIFISSETKLPNYLDKYSVNLDSVSMHNLLYHSSLFIGEGVTMCAEASILGTPSILIYPNRDLGSVSFLESKKMLTNISSWNDLSLNLINDLEINDKLKWLEYQEDLLSNVINVSKFFFKEIISNE